MLARAMSDAVPLEVAPPSFAGLIGVARRDTTPPVGIYSRMWGAASHDQADGVHRPLCATVLALRASREAPLRLLVALDLGMLGDIGSPSDGERVLAPLYEALHLEPGQVIVNCSHTHAGPSTATARGHLPGGGLIAPYLDRLGKALADAAREAVTQLTPATLSFASGRCDLAANRDLPDPSGRKRVVCGYNPAAAADDTLLVGRVTDDADGGVIATLVNYACHPTTLAWENHLLSPDYVGALRELVEQHSGGAPCLFLQGASGELSPAHQYVGDPAVADQHGRRLGFAALATLSGMLAPGQALAYATVVQSGAPLAVWRPAPFAPPRSLAGGAIAVSLPLKPLPPLAELERELAATSDRVGAERLFRKSRIVESLGGGGNTPVPAWVWRAGQVLFVAHPNEAYSSFQQELRGVFPDCAVVVMNTSGHELGYLHPAALAGADVYQVWQTPFAAGALEILTDACIAEGRRLLASSDC